MLEPCILAFQVFLFSLYLNMCLVKMQGFRNHFVFLTFVFFPLVFSSFIKFLAFFQSEKYHFQDIFPFLEDTVIMLGFL